METGLARLVLFASALCGSATSAQAQEGLGFGDFTLSGHVAGVSEYRFRGISLSDEDPALQGSLVLSHASGPYVGAWASSLAGFGDFGGSSVELDLYSGYRAELGLMTLDAGLLWYLYPGTNGTDYAEPYANVTVELGPASAKLGVAYAPEQEAIGDEDNLYLFGDASSGIPGTPLTVKAHLGWSTGASTLTPAGDYFDWLIGVDATWRALTLGVAYVDTDYGRDEARLIDPDRDIVDAAVVVSIGAQF